MMTDVGNVGSEWLTAVEALGGDREAAVQSAVTLEAAYADPARSYHGEAHIDQVVRDIRVLAGDIGLGDLEAALAVAAGCAHDVVYDGIPGEDERASATWARTELAAAGVATGLADRVFELVLATTDHRVAPGDTVGEVLMDADLAVLGSDAEAYRRYVAAVRREYAHVGEDGWRQGRSAVLQSLLDLPQLYATVPGRSRWEVRGRANLAAELAGLGAVR